MTSAKAGWAETETTPPLGLPLGGRGPRFTAGAAVLDPLNAQAVALEDPSGFRTLWVSIDLVGLGRGVAEQLRYDLSSLTAIPMEAIVLNFSHTHSGPMCGFEGYATVVPKPPELQAYEEDLRVKVIRIALQALDRMRPVTVSLHSGRSDVGINRRRKNAAGETAMAPNPDGTYLPDLWVLDLVPRTGDGRCVLFNYACHPVIVYGFAWDGISADYPGVCRRTLKAELGPDAHCQFLQGFAGNIRPRVLADLAAGKFRKSTPEDPRAAGSRLAADVLAALGGNGESLALELGAAAGRFLAPRDPARIPPRDHWETLKAGNDELARNLGDYWTQRLDSGIPPVRAVPWDVGLLRLDPGHAVAWIAGEVLSEWLGHLRAWIPGRTVLGWGYCQAGRGYLPTDELLPEGGYEVDRSNNYSTTGPGPFATGLNESAWRTFQSLTRQVFST